MSDHALTDIPFNSHGNVAKRQDHLPPATHTLALKFPYTQCIKTYTEHRFLIIFYKKDTPRLHCHLLTHYASK
ncbi:hypothetical protein CIP107567_00214 [Corynebacterium diphtheriae]|nr:hypothetical protein CIP107567_00214 [Corynebacterium diphtheriae]CAB0629989.1 hypothetical protein CIP107571_00279 [Corynebacterium diphtheriae]